MKTMNEILLGIFLLSGAVIIPGCKTSFILSDGIKNIAQNLTPEEAAHKLSAIIDTNKSSGCIGLDEVVAGGLTKVTKDSITYYKTLLPKIDKTYSNFTNGYETVPTFTEKRDLVITVSFNRVKSVKLHELKNGDLRITLKDSHDSFITKTMYQFDSPAVNRELAIALCLRLIPNAKINY
jgi:hypothetical protein